MQSAPTERGCGDVIVPHEARALGSGIRVVKIHYFRSESQTTPRFQPEMKTVIVIDNCN